MRRAITRQFFSSAKFPLVGALCLLLFSVETPARACFACTGELMAYHFPAALAWSLILAAWFLIQAFLLQDFKTRFRFGCGVKGAIVIFVCVTLLGGAILGPALYFPLFLAYISSFYITLCEPKQLPVNLNKILKPINLIVLALLVITGIAFYLPTRNMTRLDYIYKYPDRVGSNLMREMSLEKEAALLEWNQILRDSPHGHQVWKATEHVFLYCPSEEAFPIALQAYDELSARAVYEADSLQYMIFNELEKLTGTRPTNDNATPEDLRKIYETWKAQQPAETKESDNATSTTHVQTQ